MNKISSFFQRHREEGAPSSAQGRLHIDCLLGTTVIGWGCTADLKPISEFILQIAQQSEPVEILACERRDVSDSLGVSAALKFGFRLQLPTRLWADSGELVSRELVLFAADQRIAIAVPPSLAQLVQGLEGQEQHPEWQSAVTGLLQQLASAQLPLWLNDAHLAKIQDLAQRIGWLQWPRTVAQPCQGHLEIIEGLVWSGWVFGACPEDETLRLYVNGRLMAVSVIRTDRADVALAMKTPRRQLGFEIEVPSNIWDLAGPTAKISLELWAGTLNLCPEAIEWTTADLSQHLAALQSRLQAQQPNAPLPTFDAESQYVLLVGLEHLIAARDGVDLPSEVRQWFQIQAERFGLGAQLAIPSPDRSQVAQGPQHDLTTIEVWDLLRRFNSLVAHDGEDAPDVLERMCRERPWGQDTQHRFVAALIPYFCGIGQYEALRPWISMGQLKSLGSEPNAWSLSLLLPELVWGEHYSLAQRVMWSLASSQSGWLNTECIDASVWRALEYWPTDPTYERHAIAFVEATLSLLDAQSATYWGRSHDHHLTRTAAGLVVFMRRLSPDLALLTQSSILRQQAFHPAFWSLLSQQWPDTATWPVDFQLAHSRFKAYEASVWAGDFAPSTWVPILCGSAAQGNRDAAQALREMSLHAATQPERFRAELSLLPSLLCSLSPQEMLRLAAHPHCQPVWLRQPSALAQLIKGSAPVQLAAMREWRRHVLRTLWGGATVDPAAHKTELTLLSELTHAGLGVILSVLSRVVNRPPTGQERTLAGLSDIRAHWLHLFGQSEAQPIPPQALLHAWSLLWRLQSTRPGDNNLKRIVSEWRHLSCARYGLELASIIEGPPKDRCVLLSPDPLRTALVAIYSCRKNLESRVSQIQASWGLRLDAMGIPWVVVVGDGDGQLESNVLQLSVPDSYEALPLKTLALIRWVHEQTDFSHLIKIDDDCHLAVDLFFECSPHLAHHYLGRKLSRNIGDTDRVWHQSKSVSPLAHQAIDKSPEPSEYADGGSGYCLSRFAMGTLLKSLTSTAGARLMRSAYLEDKLVGDLLSLAGIKVCEEGYDTLVRRRFGSDPTCVNAYSNTFYPSQSSPTLVSHLDDAVSTLQVETERSEAMLRPAKIWPSYETPKIRENDSNQLELLSPLSALSTLHEAKVIVVGVLRNELLLLPHFLAHYRKLGASHFVLVDNLSDDGSRAYLLSQSDVVLYSADTEYRQSHFGVAWQQAVLAAHALGKWVVLADIDEFLIYQDCEKKPLAAWVSELEQDKVNAVTTLMIDMYPKGPLAEANFNDVAPFDCAPYFDRAPLIAWKLGSGCFSNGRTWLSGLRHRLIDDSAPNLYTSQKVATLKYQPWIRLSEGLHYASNVIKASEPAFFAHFKYHSGFDKKVREEIARKQHFNDAEEYQRYTSIIAEGRGTLWTRESVIFSEATDYYLYINPKKQP